MYTPLQAGCKKNRVYSEPLVISFIIQIMDYGCPVRKLSLLHGWKSTPSTKFLGTAEAYFVCHIGNLPHQPKFSDFFDLCLHWLSIVHDPDAGTRLENMELLQVHRLCTLHLHRPDFSNMYK